MTKKQIINVSGFFFGITYEQEHTCWTVCESPFKNFQNISGSTVPNIECKIADKLDRLISEMIF